MADGVNRLTEGLRAVTRRRPFREGEATADHTLALEEVDEVVEPVDEERLDAVRLGRERVALALLDRLQPADELEQSEPGRGEEPRTVCAADDEADVGLVLEGLPAQGKT